MQDYDADAGDSYYRAVLQNLFFATLNTEISERGFSAERDSTHRVFSRYRYGKEIADPDGLLALFAKTPFINGGLFDCLDSEESTGRGGYRIDCFTDNVRQRSGYSIPNRLFFGQDANGANPGLITLFNRYKFTVEENTPAEREVALDPELLGKVFENLLAAFNPETRENVRKQTGSYYTPRAVVDYMVDEALAAALAQKAVPAGGDAESWATRLRHLLDYDVADAPSLFSDPERAAIVRAIAEIKVLDPAVGSGAFPMGVLHKLTLALRRLDPRNELWEALQKELAGQRAASAFDTADQSERDAELREISATFQRYRDTDFGRKLYLIQNGIYGVDIQPIATQIAKLRFFISLAIDQEPALAAPGSPARRRRRAPGRRRRQLRHQAPAQPGNPLRRRQHPPRHRPAGPARPDPGQQHRRTARLDSRQPRTPLPRHHPPPESSSTASATGNCAGSWPPPCAKAASPPTPPASWPTGTRTTRTPVPIGSIPSICSA